ncbi:MAG: acyl-CoA dehydrogenase [Bacteroidetes bacterium]|nr:acyl-CoA dehydrogenase [Bacteroidota bacterium]
MELPLYGNLINYPLAWTILALALVAIVLSYVAAPLVVWTFLTAVALYGLGASATVWIVFAVLAILFNVPPVRRLLSGAVMKLLNALNFLPSISRTEKEAIDAGTVWVEGELFSGRPDFKRMMSQSFPDLSDEERAFLEGPVNQVCEMTDDWEVFKNRKLPDAVWDFLKRERFFGMIIPKEYGGLGFGPSANSAVVAKVATCSTVLGITVMVPNSLGPAELLIHYGTDAQKKRYLPSLANGTDLPAFALTEPGAGSDAGAISANGVVFKDENGKLYLRLNWRKRYITLAAVSTVLGLAFKLYDPDELLGRGKNLGITCALVPTDIEGVKLGRRHDPMGVPFYNCPTEGHDVVLPLEEAIIGGRDGAGRGWRMLMESLSAGRGISLPATSTGGVKHIGRAASAHGVVRRQFGLPIGRFEGIEEPLARIGGFAYLLDAARRYTNGGLDSGAKPAVVTAMAKYNFTELARIATNDAMDILGGNAISRGPRNTLANLYVNTPVSITVEGANILTRTLMIFGQGAIRCHPYALKEIQALETNNVREFDAAFWKHIGHVISNATRALVLSVTRGLTARSPVGGPSARYFRKLAWASASFAFLADLAMGSLGGDLKRKEKLTGRFADIFSWMYLCTAVLRRFEAEGRRSEDLPFLHWSVQYGLGKIQEAFDGLYQNLRVPMLTWFFRGPVAAWSRLNSISGGPSDSLGHEVASAIQVPGEQRDRLFSDTFVSENWERGIARSERAMKMGHDVAPLEKKLKNAVRAGDIPRGSDEEIAASALKNGLLTESEYHELLATHAALADAVEVDDYSLEEYLAMGALGKLEEVL